MPPAVPLFQRLCAMRSLIDATFLVPDDAVLPPFATTLSFVESATRNATATYRAAVVAALLDEPATRRSTVVRAIVHCVGNGISATVQATATTSVTITSAGTATAAVASAASAAATATGNTRDAAALPPVVRTILSALHALTIAAVDSDGLECATAVSLRRTVAHIARHVLFHGDVSSAWGRAVWDAAVDTLAQAHCAGSGADHVSACVSLEDMLDVAMGDSSGVEAMSALLSRADVATLVRYVDLAIGVYPRVPCGWTVPPLLSDLAAAPAAAMTATTTAATTATTTASTRATRDFPSGDDTAPSLTLQAVPSDVAALLVEHRMQSLVKCVRFDSVPKLLHAVDVLLDSVMNACVRDGTHGHAVVDQPDGVSRAYQLLSQLWPTRRWYTVPLLVRLRDWALFSTDGVQHVAPWYCHQWRAAALACRADGGGHAAVATAIRAAKGVAVNRLLTLSPSAMHLRVVQRWLVRYDQPLLARMLTAADTGFPGCFALTGARGSSGSSSSDVRVVSPQLPYLLPHRFDMHRLAPAVCRALGDALLDAAVSSTTLTAAQRRSAMIRYVALPSTRLEDLVRLLARGLHSSERDVIADGGTDKDDGEAAASIVASSSNGNDVRRFAGATGDSGRASDAVGSVGSAVVDRSSPLPTPLLEVVIGALATTDSPLRALVHLLTCGVLSDDRARVGAFVIKRLMARVPAREFASTLQVGSASPHSPKPSGCQLPIASSHDLL